MNGIIVKYRSSINIAEPIMTIVAVTVREDVYEITTPRWTPGIAMQMITESYG